MAPLVAEPLLSLQAIADIAVHVQDLPVSAGNGKGPGTALAPAQQLYERDCASCHGKNGEGAAASFVPMVAAQHYRYLLRELVNIRDGTRRNSNAEMVKRIGPYTPADLDMLADYLSRLPPPTR
jgi:cytochrome c553